MADVRRAQRGLGEAADGDHAAASSELVLTRPQNAEPETLSIPTGSGVQICGEVLTVKQTDGISTSSTATGSGSSSSIVQ